jgi:hypothetical protein
MFPPEPTTLIPNKKGSPSIRPVTHCNFVLESLDRSTLFVRPNGVRMPPRSLITLAASGNM